MTKKNDILKHIEMDSDKVLYIANLVQLGITEKEAASFSPQLGEIINYLNLLNEVETIGIPPDNMTSRMQNVMRTDEVEPSMSRDEFLKIVPVRNGDRVQVPRVFGVD